MGDKSITSCANYIGTKVLLVGLGGLGVTCSPRDPRFAGSRLRSMDFFKTKNPEHKSSGRYFKLGVPESEISGSLKKLKPEKLGL